ncbi:YlmH/Sll1252 family protein, partial [Bacillus atrophaeus]
LMFLFFPPPQFGDLLFAESAVQLIVTAETEDFVAGQLTHASKAKDNLEKISLSDLQIPARDVEIRDDTVSSLRLDAVFSSLLLPARHPALTLVKNG